MGGCTAPGPAPNACASTVDTGPLPEWARAGFSGVTESRSVPGGPGPSIIDLPRPGCWRLTLTWPEHNDTMALVYR